jgi:hypothetical protein
MDMPGRRWKEPGRICTDTGCGITFSVDGFTTVAAAAAPTTAAARTINWRALLFI